MERAEIAELFYAALIGSDDVEQLFRFLSRGVERILSADQLAETDIAAKITFQGLKIIKGQIRISWPLLF